VNPYHSGQLASREPASAGQGTRIGTRRRRYFLTVLVIIVAAASLLASAYTLHWFNSGPHSCGATTSNVPRYFHFTIVISLSGYNDSQHHSRPWPIMNVTVNWEVIIHILNNDTSQTHGFAITHYFDQGVPLQPGNSCDLTFFASQTGTFPVYNTIFDTTDLFEHAQLNVNSQ
jgi:hypothetical protein